MQTRIEGFSVRQAVHRRYGSGMVADLWSVDCAERAGGHYVGSDPRIFALLETKAITAQADRFTMTETGGGTHDHTRRRGVSFIPAGLEMETALTGIGGLRHLDLHFDVEALQRRLGEDLNAARLDRPRLIVEEPRILALADLIAAECAADEPLHDLYGDGLTLALLIDLLRIAPTPRRRRSTLAGWQLRRAIEFIEVHCLRAIRLEELAALTGLSESYFSHAFKVATGIPPHQWQMRARIERVKQQLSETETPLTVVAAETGFADAAHFSRVFRRQTGLSPSEWRRAHRRRLR